uniref:Putative ovule protein n=1 Tax=Solanum chacoense TaxID=4108 RepID=A0A0V0IPX0_SOLCH
MHDYLMAEDNKLWDIVLDGPFIPTTEVNDGEITKVVPKTCQQYTEADRKKIEKSYKAKKLLVCGIGAEEYNCISACELAKEIWDCLRTAHEGTEQVKESEGDMLITQYENFKMKRGDTIHDMHTKLSSITNELRSLGEPISISKQVRKVLRILPKSWESKVDAITEAKDLKVLIMDGLIGNLKTHEMNRNQNISKKEAKKNKSLVLKDGLFAFMAKSDDEDNEDKVTLLDIKQNLNTYSVRRLRNLANVLIDSVIELTTEKDSMNISLDILSEEKTVTTAHMSFIEEQLTVLEAENLELKNQLSLMIEKSGKRKGEVTSLQTELEASLNTAETQLL